MFDAPECSRIDQNVRRAASHMLRLPGSGPKKPPGDRVPVILPKLLAVVHNAALPGTIPSCKLSPEHPTFGLAKWGVLVRLKASARTCNVNRSVSLKLRATLRST